MKREDYKPSGKNQQLRRDIELLTKLVNRFGRQAVLGLVLDNLAQPEGHECPKCNGKGSVTVAYNAYPAGFPDSGWAEDIQHYQAKCDVCDGDGYTKKKLVPNMVQQGWKSE